MNPYEQPIAELSSPDTNQTFQDQTNQGSIQWLAILVSGLICLVVSAILFATLYLLYPPGRDAPRILLNILFFVPWVLGAFFLGWRAKFRWVSHGFIYSVIPPLVTLLMFATVNRRFHPDMLSFVAIGTALSLAITPITMVLTRLALGMKLTTKPVSASLNQHAASP